MDVLYMVRGVKIAGISGGEGGLNFIAIFREFVVKLQWFCGSCKHAQLGLLEKGLLSKGWLFEMDRP